MEKRSKGAHRWPLVATTLLLIIVTPATMEMNEADSKETRTTYPVVYSKAAAAAEDSSSDDDDGLYGGVQDEFRSTPSAPEYPEGGGGGGDDNDMYNEEGDYDSDDDNEQKIFGVEYSQPDDAIMTVQKRNIGALARNGDMAARRIYALRLNSRRNAENVHDEQLHESMKRHIGSFERGGGYRPKPSTSRNGKKRDYNDGLGGQDEDEQEEEEEEEDGLMPKRNIASLARQGTLTNLRYQRRPTPWIGEDEYGNGYVNAAHDDSDHHDGYKRNIHAFSRVSSTPGSGFRTWLRERLSSASSPSSSKDATKRHRNNHFRLANIDVYGGGGRLHGSRDRFRGIRSTRHRYTNNPDFIGRLGGDGTSSPRAPMAFVSRHHLWKRAIMSGEDFLRGLRSHSDDAPSQKDHHQITI